MYINAQFMCEKKSFSQLYEWNKYAIAFEINDKEIHTYIYQFLNMIVIIFITINIVTT